MQTFKIKRNDTSPVIRYQLGGAEINLVGASVVFNMQEHLSGETIVLRGPAVIEMGQYPIVAYAWQPGDTAIAGKFLAEFEVTFGDGGVETFPNDSMLMVVVNKDMG